MRTDQQPQTTPGRTTHAHEHGWHTESTHRALEGVVRYVRCAGCGARRIDLDAAVVPTAASRVLGGAGGSAGGSAGGERTGSVGEQRS